MKKIVAVIAIIMVFCMPYVALADSVELLVVNGNFEDIANSTSLPLGWSLDFWNEAASSTAMAEDTQSERGMVAYLNCPVDDDSRLVQTITVEPNSYYLFSCDIKTKGVKGGEWGANISVLNSFAKSDALSGDNDWTSVSFYGHTGPEQTTIDVAIRIGGYGNLSTGEAWFDNVTVTKTDAATAGNAPMLFTESQGGNNNNDGDSDELPQSIPYYNDIVFVCLATFGVMAFVCCRHLRYKDTELVLDSEKRRHKLDLIMLLGIALIIRVLCNYLVTATTIDSTIYGHSTDMNCFIAWGNRLLKTGPGAFYSTDYFCDYPPGYIYVLGAFAGLSNLFGFVSNSASGSLMIKLPAIFADIALAYIAYRVARRTGRSQRASLLIMSLFAFNPVSIFLSGGWGQIDSVLTLLLLVSALLFIDGTGVLRFFGKKAHVERADAKSVVNWRLILSGAAYGLAILVKPQALMAGPIFAIAFLLYIVFAKKHDTDVPAAILNTLLAVASAFVIIIGLSLPFFGLNTITGLLDKYAGTATSYNYASVEAYNFMTLIGGNWVSADSASLLGITYAQMGTVLMGVIILLSAAMYVYGRKKLANTRCIMLCLSFMLIGLFTFGHFMHERYILPGAMLLLFAAIMHNDKRLYALFSWFSVSALLNVLGAFIIIDNRHLQTSIEYEVLSMIGSAMTVIGCLTLLYVCVDILFMNCTRSCYNIMPPQKPLPRIDDEGNKIPVKILPAPTDNKLHFTKRDRWFICGVTFVYALVALSKLGTTQAPENAWEASISSPPAVIEFEQDVSVSSIYVYGGIANKGRIAFADDAGNFVEGASYTQDYGHMYRWHKIAQNLSVETSAFTVRVESGNVNLLELAFFDANGKYIPATTQGDAYALTDEPEQVAEQFSYLNGMYFDELYHGRTAYENIHNLPVYETTHPPLGKIFISIGISIFGMNAFGWRIIGTLFGIAMVPIMYCFGKRLFRRSEFALLTAVLMAFDFMHFTQTRIATIDTYGVFFIILMFYYMYQYMQMNFYVDGLKKTLKPLALCGLFFGLGAASKWIGFYAGLGLLVMFMLSLAKRYAEYQKIMREGTEEEKILVASFSSYLVKTLAWCVLFFLAVPFAIYTASFIVYPDVNKYLFGEEFSIGKYFERVWYYQNSMFNYHSGLTATHTYQSAWYEWPLILRPTWFYKGGTTSGLVASISTFGSPAVWWTCLAGTIALWIQIARDKIKQTPAITMAFIGIACNLGPWTIVTRCTFIYHYFATVPFIIFCAVYFLKYLEEKHNWLSYVKWGWMITTVGLFAMFYPVISGVPIPQAYMNLLMWLPSWTFLGVQGPDAGRYFGVAVVAAIIAVFVIVGMYKYNVAKKKGEINPL